MGTWSLQALVQPERARKSTGPGGTGSGSGLGDHETAMSALPSFLPRRLARLALLLVATPLSTAQPHVPALPPRAGLLATRRSARDLWCPGAPARGTPPAAGDETVPCYKIPSLLRRIHVRHFWTSEMWRLLMI